MDEGRISGIERLYPTVRERMAPDRRHIVMDVAAGEFVHFVSSYEDKWPEIFLPPSDGDGGGGAGAGGGGGGAKL
eukprot:SAG22_NODE_403_length_11012_cov_12.141024_13_plen_75_part_00